MKSEPSGCALLGCAGFILAIGGAAAFVADCAHRRERAIAEKRAADEAIDAQRRAERLQEARADGLVRARTIKEAWDAVASEIQDNATEIDPTVLRLAVWYSDHVSYPGDVAGMKKTTVARVLKTPAAERGSAICLKGQVTQIGTVSLEGRPVALGGMVAKDSSVLRFAAVRSTENVVFGTQTEFCGVITGAVAFENAGGWTTHAAQAVGMFSIPENAPPKKTTGR
jgi:hypothetical protein